MSTKFWDGHGDRRLVPRLSAMIFLAVALTALGGARTFAAGTTSIEMVELIEMLMPPQGEAEALGDWSWGAQPGSPITWATTGIEEATPEEHKAGYPYRRVGKAVLDIDEKPTHQILEKNVVPGKWNIILLGPRGGFTRVILNTFTGGELGGGMLLKSLETQLPSRHYRCKPDSISSGNEVFVVEVPGKKPIWINEEWSCGSGGCGVSLDIVFTKKAADKFACF
ncbi:hypothetical protein [Geoalkalibacter sp.]|uniref:hypothetical protein n=1 Tax=Geoalkalibacter sp. TaxID=3041440 RepID=UPI00272E5C29|nr:hypothetical protein [Geoalkalibacter sp.]